MALKDIWTDKIDGVDDVMAETTNQLAHAIIENEEDILSLKNDRQRFANTLLGKVSGAVVAMDDVSPLAHKVPIKLSSKNLIPYPFSSQFENNTTYIKNGITFTKNDNGSITLNGTATADADAFIYSSASKPYPLMAGYYCFSGSISNDIWIKIDKRDANGTVKWNWGSYTNKIGEANEGDMLHAISIYVKSGTVCDNVVVYPQMERGTVATAHTAPLTEDTVVTVKSYGKNLISSDIWGDLFEKQEDGSYLSTQLVSLFPSTISLNLPVDIYTVSYFVKCPVGSNYRLRIQYEDETYKSSYVESTGDYVYGTFTTEAKKIAYIQWDYGKSGTEVQFKDLQIELGTVATAYEPYTEYETVTTTIADGAELNSVAPNMTIYTDTAGVVIDCSYNKDTNVVINNLFEEIANLKATITELGGTT